MHEEGNGVQQDYLEARRYYEKSAQLDNSLALLYLGNSYKNGFGIEKNYTMAKSYYLLAVKHNLSDGLFYMAEFFSEGGILNIDLFTANYFFIKCTKINNNKIIYNDSNVPEIKEHNYKITNKYRYQSYNNLGSIYITVFEDFEKSHSFIKEEAFAEFPYGQNNLGLLNQFYLNNIEYAEYMYERSSRHNFALGHYNLGYL